MMLMMVLGSKLQYRRDLDLSLDDGSGFCSLSLQSCRAPQFGAPPAIHILIQMHRGSLSSSQGIFG
jgi:hypothetical protein